MNDVTPQNNGEPENMAPCPARREFLTRAGMTAGGLALALSGLPAVADEDGAAGDAAAPKGADVVVKFGDNQKLYEVGGAVLVETPNGKVNVVHPDEATFVACAATCTHRGGQLAYDPATKQFACPVHGARFDLSGNVVKGPARQPLQSFTADPALVVAPKPNTNPDPNTNPNP